ncbi:hypothetical protein J6590_042612 [Homalodisca vitripennis]|nr:hypothetical protein J6590_042612 [Homalodisca vitripennis]
MSKKECCLERWSFSGLETRSQRDTLTEDTKPAREHGTCHRCSLVNKWNTIGIHRALFTQSLSPASHQWVQSIENNPLTICSFQGFSCNNFKAL